jgi:hypothetical protein
MGEYLDLSRCLSETKFGAAKAVYAFPHIAQRQTIVFLWLFVMKYARRNVAATVSRT